MSSFARAGWFNCISITSNSGYDTASFWQTNFFRFMANILRVLGFLIIVVALGRWGYDCQRYGDTVYYTKTSKITVTSTVDPLFGTAVESTTTEQGYWLGLLDSAFPFGALPICGFGGALVLVGSLQVRSRRKKGLRD